MEIYDSSYFIYNKRLQVMLGIWPYQSHAKNLIKYVGLVLVMIAMLIPQFIRLKTYLGKDVDKTMENIFILFYVFAIFNKLFIAHFAEEQLKFLYESTARNFEIYTDEMEAKIMKQYSERGRYITIGYLILMPLSGIVYTLLPMYPIIMDSANPLDHPRTRMFILNGDYLVDKYEYYFQIYTLDIIAVALMICILCATDPMYAVIVEHCLGLFAICKYRLRNFNKSCGIQMVEDADAQRYEGDYAYAALVRAITLHKDVLKYTEIIQTSYSLYFLLEMGATVGLMVTTSVVVVMKQSEPLELVRWTLLLGGVVLHIFFLTWPGQKLINISGDIFQEAYLNDWYKSSLKCQNLLRFISLRCLKPCEMSGGGMYVMNFINFATILKTSASYITVFSSV